MNAKDHARFKYFHKKNPHIFNIFEKVTINHAKCKRQKGAKAIIEDLRWNQELRSCNKPWKLDNTFTSLYARMFAKKNPAYRSYFKFRGEV